MADEQIVVKKGVNIMSFTLSRGRGGLQVRVKLIPEVEELIKSWGNGESLPVGEFGRAWVGKDHSGDPLRVYHMRAMPRGEYRGGQYDLNPIGHGFDEQPGVVNLSFLRLVGISEHDGLTFTLKGGLYSLDAIHALSDKIGDAVKRLYADYLMPVDVSVFVSTQEVRL